MMCTSCGRDHVLEDELVKQAQRVVLGVITAREQDNPADASMLISCFLEDARAEGAEIGTAWAMLFSASTLWVAALVNLHADHHGQTTLEAISDIAIAHAQGIV